MKKTRKPKAKKFPIVQIEGDVSKKFAAAMLQRLARDVTRKLEGKK